MTTRLYRITEKVKQKWYLDEEKEELKLNILKALQQNPFLTKEQLQKKFYVGKFIVESILDKCKKEGLIMRLGNARKVLTRKGQEYLENNY